MGYGGVGALVAVALLAIGYFLVSRQSVGQGAPVALEAMIQEASEAFEKHRLGQPVFNEALKGKTFDYSIESLKLVDDALEQLRSELPRNADETRDLSVVDNKALMRLVSCTGSYLGEVIRRNSSQVFRWKDFDGLPETAKNVFGGHKDMSNFAVLEEGKQGNYSLPMNRVGRFLINGPEDSLYVFAKSTLDGGDD